MKRQRGFTLVEMVVAITVSAIVVGFMALFLVTPVQAYLAQERRVELKDSANNATRLFEDDVHRALPNSVRFVRNGSIVAVEMLNVAGVARYRAVGSAGNPDRELD